jgi:hypothetical protein
MMPFGVLALVFDVLDGVFWAMAVLLKRKWLFEATLSTMTTLNNPVWLGGLNGLLWDSLWGRMPGAR